MLHTTLTQKLEETMKRLAREVSRSFSIGALRNNSRSLNLTRRINGGPRKAAAAASMIEGVLPRSLESSRDVSNYKNMYDSLVEMYSVSEGAGGGGGVISVTRFIDVRHLALLWL